MTRSRPDTSTAVYRVFNAAGDLLYIGCSEAVLRRLVEHRREREWYAEAATVTIEHFPDRPSAFVAEEKAIVAERPRYNGDRSEAARRSMYKRLGKPYPGPLPVTFEEPS